METECLIFVKKKSLRIHYHASETKMDVMRSLCDAQFQYRHIHEYHITVMTASVLDLTGHIRYDSDLKFYISY